MPRAQLEALRRNRRHPRLSQFDGLHLQLLRDELATKFAALGPGVEDVLDVYCGARPYDDLLPAGAKCIGLDIDDHYGTADVISTEFLPFESETFDLVLSIESFYYVDDPAHAASEMMRVLRPGGQLLLAIPFAWEYDRSILERRYTGPQLAEVFADWEDVEVTENGGRAVVWALLTGRLLALAEAGLPKALRLGFGPLFRLAYLMTNLIASGLDRIERSRLPGTMTLPMNLTLTARRPSGNSHPSNKRGNAERTSAGGSGK
jgi:SAM-dependent methyltransferase